MLAVCFLLFAQASAMPPAPGEEVKQAVLRFIDIQAGTGAAAQPGQKYTVHYTGWLKDGAKFHSSVDRNQPFEFVQGRRLVIAGWEAGFEGMKVGGKRRLFIPYQFAYGAKGRDPIPPKAELIFDVELLGVADVAESPAGADLLLSLADLERKALALVKAFPEERFAWRPAPGVRSVGEVFVHMALGNRLLHQMATEDPSPDALKQQIRENAAKEKQPVSREAILQMLTDSFAEVRKTLETARAGALAREVPFFASTTTQRGVLTMLQIHLAEHTGQAIAYARMNGIAPPWSE